MSHKKLKKNDLKEKMNYWLAPINRFFIRKDINTFIENLSVLLSAGLEMSKTLEVIEDEASSKKTKKIFAKIRSDVGNGFTLSSSIKSMNLMPGHLLEFIYLGEQSGKLVDNLKILVFQTEKEEVFKSKIRSTLLYSVIVISLAVVIGFGTAWFTLPKIAGMYADMGAELPAITKMLIILGEFLAKYGFVVAPIFFSTILISLYFLFSFPKTKFVGHSLLFKMPLIKSLIKEVEISRFGFLMGTMLEAGIPISEALKSVPAATTFKNYGKFYQYLYENIHDGNSFHEAIVGYEKINKLWPTGVRQMIIAAEKVGDLSGTLMRIGKIYEKKAEATARNLPIVLEPLIMVVIGTGVAIFVIGTMLPIFNIADLV